MTNIDFTNRVSLQEAAQLIAAIGTTNTILLRGEKGIGKSAIMKILPEYLGAGYEYAYFDMGNKSEGDTAIPFPDKERKVMEFFINTALKMHSGNPVVIMLDEFGKASRSIQNMMHTLLEVDGKRIQDTYLPAGSIVFLTTNLAEEGLGDTLLEHTLDRLTVVEVRKPNAKEWLPWAAEHDIHPALMAWVDQTPTVLASFRDDDFDVDNPYVCNPKRVQGKIITPRSLELGSNAMWGREKITPNALTCALVGTVGNAGANDIASFLAYQDEIPTRTSIIDAPDTATIPGSVGAIVTLLFNLERAVDSDTITPIMKYIGRLEAEHQAVFCTTLARSKSKQKIAFTNRAFTDWARENQDIL
jgi:hypothetical protein